MKEKPYCICYCTNRYDNDGIIAFKYCESKIPGWCVLYNTYLRINELNKYQTLRPLGLFDNPVPGEGVKAYRQVFMTEEEFIREFFCELLTGKE